MSISALLFVWVVVAAFFVLAGLSIQTAIIVGAGVALFFAGLAFFARKQETKSSADGEPS